MGSDCGDASKVLIIISEYVLMAEAFRISTPDLCGRRTKSRHDLQLVARLVTSDMTADCILVDVSLTGARVRLRNSLGTSCNALLIWESHETVSRVVWAADDGFRRECGLEFKEEITETIVREMRQARNLSASKCDAPTAPPARSSDRRADDSPLRKFSC